MKLQGLSVIFALIVLPLILVLSYYIQLQVDTVAKQSAYDNKLLNSTYDALSSFEINTANEDMSTVSDSLRTIIEASYNTFITTLATNLGMSGASKSFIEPYIPALVYTLYDGYYIYSPTQVPTMLVDDDGVAITVGDKGVSRVGSSDLYTYDESSEDRIYYDDAGEDYGQVLFLCLNPAGGTTYYRCSMNDKAGTLPIKYETKNVLKTYMPYSARYNHTGAGANDYNSDVNIVYSLDNYVTVEGTVNDVYYTESGYLVDLTSVKVDEIFAKVNNSSPTAYSNTVYYNQSDAEAYIKAGNLVNVSVYSRGKTGTEEITFSSGTSAPDKSTESYDYFIEEIRKANNSLNDLENPLTPEQQEPLQQRINEFTQKKQQMEAVCYFTKAYIFSSWIHSHLGNLKESDIYQIAGQSYSTISEMINGKNNGIEELLYDCSKSNKLIFSFGSSTFGENATEISESSTFYAHKMNIIRNSIQYNLNQAMSAYNNNENSSFNYQMPVMTSQDWDRILTYPSIASFMQGWSCGLKVYSNYKIVSSVNNEISVPVNNIYFVEHQDFCNSSSYYHQIDCPRLAEVKEADKADQTIGANPSGLTNDEKRYIAFLSKDVKYDKISGKGINRQNYYYDHKNLACYKCIVDGNYKNGDRTILDTNIKDVNIWGKDDISSTHTYKYLRKAFYIGVGAMREEQYKMNAFQISEGYEILTAREFVNGDGYFKTSNTEGGINEVKGIEFVFGTIQSRDSNDTSFRFKVKIKGDADSSLVSDKVYSVTPNSLSNTSVYVEFDPSLTGNRRTDKFSNDTIIFDPRINGVGGEVPSSEIFIKSYTDAEKNDGAESDNYIKRFDRAFKHSLLFVKVIYK